MSGRPQWMIELEERKKSKLTENKTTPRDQGRPQANKPSHLHSKPANIRPSNVRPLSPKPPLSPNLPHSPKPISKEPETKQPHWRKNTWEKPQPETPKEEPPNNYLTKNPPNVKSAPKARSNSSWLHNASPKSATLPKSPNKSIAPPQRPPKTASVATPPPTRPAKTNQARGSFQTNEKPMMRNSSLHSQRFGTKELQPAPEMPKLQIENNFDLPPPPEEFMTSQNVGREKFFPNMMRENSFSNKTYGGLEPPTPPVRNRSMSPLPEATMTSQNESEEIYDDTEVDQEIYDDAQTEELYDDTEMTSELYDDTEMTLEVYDDVENQAAEVITSQSKRKSTICMAELMRKHEERNSAVTEMPRKLHGIYEKKEIPKLPKKPQKYRPKAMTMQRQNMTSQNNFEQPPPNLPKRNSTPFMTTQNDTITSQIQNNLEQPPTLPKRNSSPFLTSKNEVMTSQLNERSPMLPERNLPFSTSQKTMTSQFDDKPPSLPQRNSTSNAKPDLSFITSHDPELFYDEAMCNDDVIDDNIMTSEEIYDEADMTTYPAEKTRKSPDFLGKSPSMGMAEMLKAQLQENKRRLSQKNPEVENKKAGMPKKNRHKSTPNRLYLPQDISSRPKPEKPIKPPIIKGRSLHKKLPSVPPPPPSKKNQQVLSLPQRPENNTSNLPSLPSRPFGKNKGLSGMNVPQQAQEEMIETWDDEEEIAQQQIPPRIPSQPPRVPSQPSRVPNQPPMRPTRAPSIPNRAPSMPKRPSPPSVSVADDELYLDTIEGEEPEETYETFNQADFGPNNAQAPELSKKEKDIRKKFKLQQYGLIIPMQSGIVLEDDRGSFISKTDLKVVSGETVDIIRMTECPRGKWLVRNMQGTIGYVESSNIQIDNNSLQDVSNSFSPNGSTLPRGYPEESEELYLDASTAIPEPEDLYEEF